MRTRSGRSRREIITGKSIEEFFQEALHSALANQGIEARARTVQYLVDLLARFSRSDALYEETEHGRGLRPLAAYYIAAAEAPPDERARLLRRMGDVALFVAGLFSASLQRKVVGLDYYISMGEGAYACVSEHLERRPDARVGSAVFNELSEKFARFVDALDEVSEGSQLSRDRDIMRLYELYLRTGSERAARRLRSLGIAPVRQDWTRHAH